MATTKKKPSKKMNQSTKETVATKEASKQVNEKAHVSESGLSSTNTLMALVLVLVAVNLVLTAGTMFTSSSSQSGGEVPSELVEQVERLDAFFAANFEGYGTEAPTQGGSEPAEPQNVEVSLEGARVLGDVDAPVTIVKYSDFRCGFCKRFNDETFDRIVEDYVDTGKAKFVYKDAPVVGGVDVANAAWCADEQGKFWEYKEGVFEIGSRITSDQMQTLAEDLGLDGTQFEECVSESRYQDRIDAEFAEARANGISGTPSFVINGQVIVGAQPYSAFQQIIDAQ